MLIVIVAEPAPQKTDKKLNGSEKNTQPAMFGHTPNSAGIIELSWANVALPGMSDVNELAVQPAGNYTPTIILAP